METGWRPAVDSLTNPRLPDGGVWCSFCMTGQHSEVIRKSQLALHLAALPFVEHFSDISKYCVSCPLPSDGHQTVDKDAAKMHGMSKPDSIQVVAADPIQGKLIVYFSDGIARLYDARFLHDLEEAKDAVVTLLAT